MRVRMLTGKSLLELEASINYVLEYNGDKIVLDIKYTAPTEVKNNTDSIYTAMIMLK